MNQYNLQSKLGEGAFSVVYRVTRKEDSQDYAMKKMKIMGFSEKQLSNCLNEVRILASIEDPNIVSYKDSFFDELTKTFCIVTEYLDGGDVAHFIQNHRLMKKNIQQKFIWRVAFNVLKGLRTLHKQKILHRDIKSANIFMNKDNKQIKLGDMNVSIVSSNGMAKTQTGTPYYASPQVWNQKPYSAKCDIWSLGCVLYQLTTFRPPFASSDMKSLKKSIVLGDYKRIPTIYSDNLQSFIRLCLKVDPLQRSTAEQLLKHSQFNNMDYQVTEKIEFKLIDKINVPRKRDFRIIKDRLPKNRFSVDKIISNNSFASLQKEKQNRPENINNSTVITKTQNSQELPAQKRKYQMLPTIRPLTAQKSKSCDKKLVNKNNQVQILQPQDRPPLPKNRPIRG